MTDKLDLSPVVVCQLVILLCKGRVPQARNVVANRRQAEKKLARVDVFDPWIDAEECEHEYGIKPIRAPKKDTYDAIVLAVAHKQFKELGINEVRSYAKKPHVLYDIKYLFEADEVDGRL